jgi:hypothetical protein
MSEHSAGTGSVTVATTGEKIDEVSYSLVILVGRDERSRQILASIKLDPSTALRLREQKSQLRLQMEDGRFFDFLVSRVDVGNGIVEVKSADLNEISGD